MDGAVASPEDHPLEEIHPQSAGNREQRGTDDWVAQDPGKSPLPQVPDLIHQFLGSAEDGIIQRSTGVGLGQPLLVALNCAVSPGCAIVAGELKVNSPLRILTIANASSFRDKRPCHSGTSRDMRGVAPGGRGHGRIRAKDA